MNDLKSYQHLKDFKLESGEILRGLKIAYHTYGKLNKDKSNVVWICHALTANSDPMEWWPGLVGDDGLINPDDHYIVCANVLGSCYGTTGPRTINPSTLAPYGMNFPQYTVKDTAKIHCLLAKHLGITSIALLMGGSFGGFQALEMALVKQVKIERLFLIATNAKETASSIATHEAQRMALKADQTLLSNDKNAGREGLRAARGLGLLTYRTFESYEKQQSDHDGRTDDFSAASYIQYQGTKLADRFHAHCYWHLTKCMDSHHVGRNRGGLVNALASIKIPVCAIGIDSDRLIPTSEQRFIARNIPGAKYHQIESAYGHDGFLIEVGAISRIIEMDFPEVFSNWEEVKIAKRA